MVASLIMEANMAQLIALPSAAFGGSVWVNPDAVGSVQVMNDEVSILKMIGTKDDIYVKGEPDWVASKLNSVRQREPV